MLSRSVGEAAKRVGCRERRVVCAERPEMKSPGYKMRRINPAEEVKGIVDRQRTWATAPRKGDVDGTQPDWMGWVSAA
ncbi:MAG: hypothetical protein U0232_31655 [Thermomicrobiales bacterium]